MVTKGGIIAIIGFFALGMLIILAISVKDFGMCIIVECETEIELTEFDVPYEVRWGGTPIAKFTIRNVGNENAKNCSVTWDYPANSGGYIVSNKFTLSPNNEKKITLIGNSGITHQTRERIYPDCVFVESYNHKWKAFVSCENTHTPTITKPLLIMCPDK